MAKQSDSKVPKIRFKGFKEEWVEARLGERVGFFTGLTYSPRDVQNGVGTLVLRSSNVKNGEIVDADNVYVDPKIVNSKNVEVGDIAVVVRNGSRSLIGKHAQIKSQMDATVIGAFMTGIHSERPSFTNALLDTPQFDKEIAKNLGATINQITTGAFKEMMFRFPLPTEQSPIGSYFQKLDQLIGLQQRKIDKLVTLKKAMLQKLFPQSGTTTPEIRFRGYSKPWDEDDFGNRVTFFGGLTYSPANVVSFGGTLVLRSSNVKDGEVVEADNVYVDSAAVNCTNVKVGDIIVVVRNGSRSLIGKHAQIKKAMFATVIGAFMTGIRHENSSFINALLDSSQFSKEIEIVFLE